MNGRQQQYRNDNNSRESSEGSDAGTLIKLGMPSTVRIIQQHQGHQQQLINESDARKSRDVSNSKDAKNSGDANNHRDASNMVTLSLIQHQQ
jgi:hypothetical protein